MHATPTHTRTQNLLRPLSCWQLPHLPLVACKCLELSITLGQRVSNFNSHKPQQPLFVFFSKFTPPHSLPLPIQRVFTSEALQHVPTTLSHVSQFTSYFVALSFTLLPLIGQPFLTFIYALFKHQTHHISLSFFITPSLPPSSTLVAFMSHSTLVGRPPQSNLMNSFNLDMYSPASAPLLPPPPPPPLPPSSSSRTDQILSRYRPIAPKPLIEGPPTPENAQQSPFSRNLSYLLTRPSRNRKRAKSGCLPASKRPRVTRPLLSSPCPLPQNTQLGLSLNSTFPRFPFPTNPATGFDKPLNLVTLPYLPYPSCSSVQDVTKPVPQLQNIPMYSQFQDITDFKSPQEMDLLQNLHASDSSPMKDAQESNVITPQAVRPVGSSIYVECIEEAPVRTSTCVLKKPEEVEMEIELDTLPAVVSDSSNRIRLTNSAYMEMVGQPECLWLGSMAYCQGKSCSRECNRIAGKVRLDLSNFRMPVSSDGFTCRAKIEWGSKEEKRAISTRCDVVKLSCVSRDYLFAWRFHTREDKKSDSQV